MTADLGYRIFKADAASLAWARAAHARAVAIAADPDIRAAHLRHGGTWFVGVNALPNALDGAVDGVPLMGPWLDAVEAPQKWHPAQLSIVYPGYPQRDPGESDANHRYRITRFAAHVDGLLPIGPERRRFLKEPHAFVLGLPLNETRAAPLMVWPGSHQIMGAAFRQVMEEGAATQVDITDVYQATRRAVFDRTTPVAVYARPGEAILLHRHLLHGVAPWQPGDVAPEEGRIIAYFRPQFSVGEWLALC